MGSKYAMVLDRRLHHMNRQDWFNVHIILRVNKRKCTFSWHDFTLIFLVDLSRSLQPWTVFQMTCWKWAACTVCRVHVSGYICSLFRRCSPKYPFNTIDHIHVHVESSDIYGYFFILLSLNCRCETEHYQRQCLMHSLQFPRFLQYQWLIT